jgi:hypothetical protein
VRIVRWSGVDVSSVALDMTNFATFIATGNGKAPIAQRGKTKQKRADLRLVGLGLVVTRDGGIPLTWHAYPGDRPDVTQFPDMIDQLRGRYEAVCDSGAGRGALVMRRLGARWSGARPPASSGTRHARPSYPWEWATRPEPCGRLPARPGGDVPGGRGGPTLLSPANCPA